MIFTAAKARNCFANAETWEYAIESSAGDLLPALSQLGKVRTNERLRRPIFGLDLADGTNIKGILAENIIKVSYPEDHVNTAKPAFEAWLSEH